MSTAFSGQVRLNMSIDTDPQQQEAASCAGHLHVSWQNMRFEREGCKPIEDPSQARLKKELALTKSAFASLTAPDGSYLQVAGGPGLFALEYRDSSGRHFRGRQATPVVRFKDGTILSFSGGSLTMRRDEWFLIDQVAEIAGAFGLGVELPLVEWKPLNESFGYAS